MKNDRRYVGIAKEVLAHVDTYLTDVILSPEYPTKVTQESLDTWKEPFCEQLGRQIVDVVAERFAVI